MPNEDTLTFDDLTLFLGADFAADILPPAGDDYFADFLADLMAESVEPADPSDSDVDADNILVDDTEIDNMMSAYAERADDILVAEPSHAVEFTAGQFTPPRIYKLMVPRADSACPSVESSEYFAADDPKFVIHNDADHSFLVFDTYAEYTAWMFTIPEANRTFHEVIRGAAPQKLKFDIDAEAEKLDALTDTWSMFGGLSFGSTEDRLDAIDRYDTASMRTKKAGAMFGQIVSAICATFADVYGVNLTERDFAISDSTDATKFSRHIVIRTYSVETYLEAQAFTTTLIAKLPAEIVGLLDKGVNKKKQNFRLPGCHKSTNSRVKRMMCGSADDMIITRVAGTTRLIAQNVQVEKTFSATSASEAEVVAMAEPFMEGLEFWKSSNNMFLFHRNMGSYCKICDRQHDADNTLFVTVNRGIVRARCRRSDISVQIGRIDADVLAAAEDPDAPAAPREPRKYVDGEKISVVKYWPSAKIPSTYSVERYCEPDVRGYDFHDGRYDTLVIKSNMGTGKTKKLVETIAALPEDVNVVIISFRCTFTSALGSNLPADFVDYRSTKGDFSAARVIVQYESLHRFILPFGKKVLLILDECESVIGQIRHVRKDTAKMRGCWERFEWLLKHSQSLIAMDAFVDFRSHILLAGRKSVHMHLNTQVNSTMQIIDYQDKAVFLKSVKAAAVNAKTEPFVIVSTVKSQADAFAKAVAAACPDAKVKFYSSDSSKAERRDFEDVNAAWADVDVLIYTSTLSAGCSFELERFTRVFAFFSDQSCDVKTSVQMMGRVRNISTHEYHIFVKQHPGQLLDTVEDITRAMAERHELNGFGKFTVPTNPLGRPMTIGADGKIDYVLKDAYYDIDVANLVERCKSRNYFKMNLFQHLAAMGAVMSRRVVELPADDRKQIISENCASIAEAAADACERIANSARIDADAARILEAQEYLDVDDRASLTAYKLIERFNIPPDSLTAKFVSRYNNRRAKRAFRNLNRLRGEMHIKATIDQCVADRAACDKPKDSIDDINEDDNLLICKIAVAALDTIIPSDTTYCSEFRDFRERYIARPTLETGLDDVISVLRKHSYCVSMLFDIPHARIMSKRETLKSKLCMVNSILDAAFGIKIQSESRNRNTGMYLIGEPAMFHWSSEANRYVVD